MYTVSYIILSHTLPPTRRQVTCAYCTLNLENVVFVICRVEGRCDLLRLALPQLQSTWRPHAIAPDIREALVPMAYIKGHYSTYVRAGQPGCALPHGLVTWLCLTNMILFHHGTGRGSGGGTACKNHTLATRQPQDVSGALRADGTSHLPAMRLIERPYIQRAQNYQQLRTDTFN